MKKEVGSAEKGLVWVFVALAAMLALSALGLAGSFSDSTQADFDAGTYEGTFYNSTLGAVTLTSTRTEGNYTSRVFDAGASVNWTSISWFQGTCYGCELPNNSATETGEFAKPANMSQNVLLLHLNEGSGATSFADSSGNGNDGSCTGAACPTATSGKFNGAFDFDGNDDYLDLGNPSSLNNFGDQLTLEAWVYPTDFAVGNNAPTFIDKDWQTGFSFYFKRSGGNKGKLSAYLVTETNSYFVQSSTAYSPSKWYYVVM
ncbi:hypothetical protein D6817_00280, partial [Candidatus Pacearchaeota archaeon]